MRDRFAAAAPYRIARFPAPAGSLPLQLRRPGLRRLVITRAQGTACAFGQAYLIAGAYVRAYAVYFDWREGSRDPDALAVRKIVWRDEASGHDCIVLRDPGGRFAGFVGVPEGHAAHGMTWEELRATHGGGILDAVVSSDRGSLHSESRSSLAEEARSPSNRIVQLRSDPESFQHPIMLVRDERWWFGVDPARPFGPRHDPRQLDLPLPPTSNAPISGEASAFLGATALAAALGRMDLRPPRSG